MKPVLHTRCMRTVAEKIRAKVTNIEELTITEDKMRRDSQKEEEFVSSWN